MEFAACHHSGAENFELDQRFLKKLHIPKYDDVLIWKEFGGLMSGN
jgi:hypothetical protein